MAASVLVVVTDYGNFPISEECLSEHGINATHIANVNGDGRKREVKEAKKLFSQLEASVVKKAKELHECWMRQRDR